MTTLVDSNVLLDIIQGDANWGTWSSDALVQALELGPLVINPVIYAEVSVRFATTLELDAALPPSLYNREPLPFGAGFLAGKAFQTYRARGGERRSPMPDFYIGAHATFSGHRLLTRDPQRYRSYFPQLRMLAPD